MSKRIKVVKNGKDKQNTYAKYMSQYKKAMKGKYYLESLVIVYAMIEDRLVAFLHYLGIITRTQAKLKVNSFCRPLIIELLEYKENSPIKLNNVSTKVNIIEKLLLLTFSDDEYLNDIISVFDMSSIREDFLCTIQLIKDWCDIRNQYIHALFNKNYIALQDDLSVDVDDGYNLARKIDIYVKSIKNNKIREKYSIK